MKDILGAERHARTIYKLGFKDYKNCVILGAERHARTIYKLG
jgi:hypothetical protein